MSSIIVSGDTSGAITIAAPAVSGTNTLTLPAKTGSFAVDGPAFSVYQNSGQALSAYTETKILFQVEDFDTNSNFASSRFTPTVAGYYQINGSFGIASSYTAGGVAIYKNGSAFRYGSWGLYGASNINASWSVAALVYLNGSTDYVEIYGAIQNAQNTNASGSFTYFNGSMVRGA